MANQLDPSDTIQGLHRAARRLNVDDEEWLVYELPAAIVDRRSTPSLVFESYQAIRRVRSYPPDWRTLSDQALLALSWTV